MMPDVETAATLAVPIWLAGAVAAALVVATLLAVKRVGGVALISSLFRVGLIAVGVLAVWLYVEQRGGSATGSNPRSERWSLDDRKAALVTSAIAPGSALSCLDEIAGEAVETACEKAVFASPEAVATAVKYVAAQFALLKDGTAYAQRDASYAAELTPLYTALEFDRFGLVAHVLGDQGCTPDGCDALMQFRDSSKVLANLRDHTFEEQVKKYTTVWNAPKLGDGPVVAPEVPPSREAPAPESAASDVMPQPLPGPAPEAAPRSTPPPPEPSEQSAAVTPLPPRRPPQVRAPPRDAAPPQLPPIDLRGTPPPPPGPIR